MIIRENVPISELTTMRIGGPARLVLEVENKDDIIKAYNFAKENPIKITVKDDGIPNTGVGVPIAVGGMGVLALVLAVLLNKKQLFPTK